MRRRPLVSKSLLLRCAGMMVSLVLAPLVPLVAQSASVAGEVVSAQGIRERREASNRAIARHDSAGFAAILAESVIVVTSASARYVGRVIYVNSMVAQFRARPDVVYRRTPDAVRVFAPWRMASEAGTWQGSWTEPDGKVEIGGRYFAKWRQVGGAWFIESETYVPERCSGSTFCDRVP
jgi:hypothetical protein